MNTHVVNKFGIDFICRDGGYDETIIKSYLKSYFDLMGTVKSHENWLDIGAHIGGFTKMIAPSVGTVAAFEPTPDTYEVLRMNVGNLQNVKTYRMAVVGTNQGMVNLYKTAGINDGINSLVTKRGRIPIPVVSFNFRRLIHHGKYRCVKMDIEGGERDILDNLTDEDYLGIDRFLLEYHFNALHDKDRSYWHKTLTTFSKNFPTVKTTLRENRKPWTCYIYGER